MTKDPLPDMDAVLAARDAREVAGASTSADDTTSHQVGPSRWARAWRRISQRDGSEAGFAGGRSRFWRTVLRAVVLVFDYLLVSVTALAVIPSLGAWLHQQSATETMQLNDAGLIALWLMPFVFMTLMVAVAEIAIMRWLWRAAGRVGRPVVREQIAGSADAKLGTTVQVSSSTASTTGRKGRKNRSGKR